MTQYPFIDIAVHDRVRERYARGEALVIFSTDLSQVLWANGAGARLFGNPSIYDLMDQGPQQGDLAYRQMATTAGQLNSPSGPRNFLMRVNSGFERITVQASVETIFIGSEQAILFAAPAGSRTASIKDIASRMIEGFDDPATHVAVLGENGTILAASSGFQTVALGENVIAMLLEGLRGNAGHVLKRPVHNANATYPAAIAQISANPALNLLFVIETPAVTEAAPDHVVAQDVSPEVIPAPEARDNQFYNAVADDTPYDVAARQEISNPAEPAQTEAASPLQDAGPSQDFGSSQDAGQDIAPGDSGFVFTKGGRPVRFVWKIDAEGVFQDVSGELALAVGPLAADIESKAFSDIADRFMLDPDGRIAALLRKRNTWSGKTVLWPVENTSLKVPVDLAALPTYSRHHDFEGFRGFGIVRVADAIEDADAIGMNLASPPLHDDLPETADISEVPQVPFEEPRYEPPALKIAETPERRFSDKVVRIDEHRMSPLTETLSSNEQAAFREIARKLGPIAGVPPIAGAPKSDDALEAAAPFSPSNENSPPADPIRKSEEQTSDQLREELRAQMPWRAQNEGLTSLVAQQLPLAMLIHSGDRLIYANPEFFRLTGDETLSALEARGGLDALLERDEDMNPDGPCMLMVSASGEKIPVNAKLQSVRWEGSSALLLALVPLPRSTTRESKEVLPPVEAVLEAAPEPVHGLASEKDLPQAAAHAAELVSLRAEVSELRSILETATDGVVILSADGDIRSLNRSASALFNYDEAEVAGKPFATLFAHESQRAVADYLAGLSGHGVASVLNDGREVIGREASGGRLPLFMTLGYLSSSASYCAVIRDITQWKRSEDELKNAKRAAETANAHKTDFLAKVSHEIRTPLNAIIGFSEMMANERFGPIGSARYIEYANDISRSGRHVLDIVNDLLDISKIEAGEMDLDFAAVRLNAAIAEAIALLQPQANSQRVIIRTALSDLVPEIVADMRSIKQIAINILANAIKFTPAGGQIVVSTSYEPNGSVALRIRDTGVGMTRDELEQAMKPFRQNAPGSSRARGEGTGLGLPLTKAMAEANRATFAVSSTPNEGTLVEIAFPSQRVLAD